MITATCHVQGRATPLYALDRDRESAERRICDQIDAFGLAGRRVRITFSDSNPTVRCEPPTDHGAAGEPPELRVYLEGTRGDWVSAIRVLSYGGGL